MSNYSCTSKHLIGLQSCQSKYLINLLIKSQSAIFFDNSIIYFLHQQDSIEEKNKPNNLLKRRGMRSILPCFKFNLQFHSVFPCFKYKQNAIQVAVSDISMRSLRSQAAFSYSENVAWPLASLYFIWFRTHSRNSPIKIRNAVNNESRFISNSEIINFHKMQKLYRTSSWC